ncbi:MAG TPA: hypothetical protein VMF66_17390 [Candidatus Acidoferrum sp.]|nr:hypothetical protein [Candidatus Acidoferrum sp.]
MNVTRDVITDLLPVYFSGEASEDTKQLVEGYFHEDPDFERIARRAATPLETLRRAAPVSPDADKEKQDLQWARDEFVRRRLAFGVALLFTFAPLATIYREGHLHWPLEGNPWMLALVWSLGSLFWFYYFARLSRRTSALAFAVFFTLLPLLSTFHLFLAGWRTDLTSRLSVAAVVWMGAAIIWVQYFRLRSNAPQQRDLPRARAGTFWKALLFWVLLVALLTVLAFLWRR